MFEIGMTDADAFQWNVTGRRRNWNFCRQIEGISGKGSDTKPRDTLWYRLEFLIGIWNSYWKSIYKVRTGIWSIFLFLSFNWNWASRFRGIFWRSWRTMKLGQGHHSTLCRLWKYKQNDVIKCIAISDAPEGGERIISSSCYLPSRCSEWLHCIIITWYRITLL